MIVEIAFHGGDITHEEVKKKTEEVAKNLRGRGAKDVKVYLDEFVPTRDVLTDIVRCAITSIMNDVTENEYLEGVIEETLGIGIDGIRFIAPDLYEELERRIQG